MKHRMMKLKERGIVVPSSDRICYLFGRKISVYGDCSMMGFYSAVVPIATGIEQYFRDWISRGIEFGKR